jgi:N-acetylglutamate synthase-like GNAT family acetyltransferase
LAYALTEPASPEDWRAFHDIRRTELFEARGRFGIYDPEHPHDRDPANRPLLLKCEGRPVGTVRLDDFGNGTGAVRLVAVLRSEQGRGHGRVLQDIVEAEARKRGIHTLYVNAAPTALGYYEKTNWQAFEWDPAELIGMAEHCVQMRKVLDS